MIAIRLVLCPIHVFRFRCSAGVDSVGVEVFSLQIPWTTPPTSKVRVVAWCRQWHSRFCGSPCPHAHLTRPSSQCGFEPVLEECLSYYCDYFLPVRLSTMGLGTVCWYSRSPPRPVVSGHAPQVCVLSWAYLLKLAVTCRVLSLARSYTLRLWLDTLAKAQSRGLGSLDSPPAHPYVPHRTVRHHRPHHRRVLRRAGCGGPILFFLNLGRGFQFRC